MANKVAVESNLSNIQEYLSSKGCQVETLDAGQMKQGAGRSNYSAMVICGADENIMGMQAIQANCPVINAHGLTPEEVYNRIQSEANRQA
jgi:hypothetical protein